MGLLVGTGPRSTRLYTYTHLVVDASALVTRVRVIVTEGTGPRRLTRLYTYLVVNASALVARGAYDVQPAQSLHQLLLTLHLITRERAG